MMSREATFSLFGGEEQDTRLCSRRIRVVFETATDMEFDYLVSDELGEVAVGQRVEVPLGKNNKRTIGYCVEDASEAKELVNTNERKIKFKKVAAIIDESPLIDANLMALARWMSEYYVCPLGQVLAAMLPSAVKKGIGASTEKFVYISLDKNQIEDALKRIKGAKQKKLISVLCQIEAFDQQNALKEDKLLIEAGCTGLPLKHLLQSGIVKISRRTVMKALPSIPQPFSIEPKEITLNSEQEKALEHINTMDNKGGFGVTMLYGVTDSGKTELYIRAIENIVRQGKNAIVLLPEIALTAQTVQRFGARFERVAIMHSGLSGAERNAQWQKIKNGEAVVVIGARSAIFAPLPNLGLVIVDEEHEPSYKQDTAPRYHGRDAAIKRCQLQNIHCLLGSATPSLETLHNCRTKKYFHLIRLTKRVMDLPMPKMEVVDMKEESGAGFELLSAKLETRLRQTLAKNEQAILLLNRRGYSNFVYCPSCRHTLQCRNCDVTLTFHKAAMPKRLPSTVVGGHIHYGYAMCHYCLSQTLVPEKCPLCGKKIIMFGLGSQRLEEEVVKKFPNTKVARIDSDAMAAKDYYRVLRDFGEGEINILAGTQMLAKGLHFPNVTLVGIISADTSLYLPDFRANERTFQLISQVAGRAGRSEKGGTVIIQTYLPQQPAINFAIKNDFAGFAAQELKHRKACNLPPLWRMAMIVLRDPKFERLTEACNAMKEKIDLLIARDNLKINVRGPMPCTISRIERFHRMQIILEAPEAAEVQKLFAALRCQPPVKPTVKIAIDIDPVNLL